MSTPIDKALHHLKRLADYDFTDPLGHRLTMCVDYCDAVELLASRPMSPEEAEAQKQSFAAANVKLDQMERDEASIDALRRLCDALDRQGYGSTSSHALPAEYDDARAVIAAPAPQADDEGCDRYDAGLLNDFGGGDVSWWHDYLRAEIERANQFHADIHAQSAAKLAEVERERDKATEKAKATKSLWRKDAALWKAQLATARDEALDTVMDAIIPEILGANDVDDGIIDALNNSILALKKGECVMSNPSYHDLYITTADIKRTSIFDLGYELSVLCTHIAGWELWRGDTLIASEYPANEQGWLVLDVASHVICDGRKSLKLAHQAPGGTHE